VGRHSAPDPDDEPVGAEPIPPAPADEPRTEQFGRMDFGQYEATERFGAREPDSFYDDTYDDSGYGDTDYGPGYDADDGSDYDSGYDAGFGAVEPDEDPVPSPPRTGPQHLGDPSEWTGSHRAVTTGRRGVSAGVIVALVAVVVVVGAVILWRFFGDALSHRSDAAAARCVDGELAVAVVADPSIVDAINEQATAYNSTAQPVGDRCVKVAVRSADSNQVVNGFTGPWPQDLGERPALWIPASSLSAARLEAVAGARTVDDSRPLVSTPVLIAIRPELKPVLERQNWGALPALQSNPSALDALGLPGWGALRLALPRSGDSDASYLAAEAIAAASAPPSAPATAGAGAVTTLLAGQPKLADDTWSTAMDALVDADDPARAPVHAVVTTEQRLYQKAASVDNAKDVLASWLPPGPTAVADYPTVLLSGDWLTPEQAAAASEFARFMRKPEQLAELAKAGFRTEGGETPGSDVVEFAPLGSTLSVGDNQARTALADMLSAPSGASTVTIMLDQSMPDNEGGKSRLDNVVEALTARLGGLPPNTAVGLWTFDGVEGRSEVGTGPLSDQVDGRPRSEALTADLRSQSASDGGAVSFTTLRLVYEQAKSSFREGQNNSVLVITAGPHTDQSLDGDGLQNYIRGAFDPARPIAVNIIDFGTDSDRDTWQAVAQATGGSYQNLATSESPELAAAIATMLR